MNFNSINFKRCRVLVQGHKKRITHTILNMRMRESCFFIYLPAMLHTAKSGHTKINTF